MSENKLIENKPEDSTEIKKATSPKKFRSALSFLKFISLSFLWVILSATIVASIFAYGTYKSYANNFSEAKKRTNSTQLVFYDNDGGVIFESYGTKQPDPVPLKDIPEIVTKATLAAEDVNFYQHNGVDLRGIARAAILNLRSSQKSGLLKLTDLLSESNYTQGGSTITQQLIKNQYLTTEKSFERKLKELVFSLELEKNSSKDKILEDYLNNVYYGEQSLGIKHAAMNYFGKDLSELTPGEATMLAGLPQAPTRLSPVSGDFKAAKRRQEYVLSMLVEQKYYTFNEAKEVANEPLYFADSTLKTTLKYPYFVDFVKKELTEKIGEDAMAIGGFEVHTSIDPKKQEEAEKIIADFLKKSTYRKVTNGSAVVLDNKEKTISAMVGGANWEESKVNVATSLRQPGSSFKPIVYLTGLLNGYTGGSLLLDRYINFGGNPPYTPRNYDGRFRGNVTLRNALQGSLNVPAVEMTKLVGPDKVAETARILGISSISEDASRYGLSIGLGSAEVKLFELTRAYSVLANKGELSSFTSIEKIVDSEGTEIYTKKKSFEKVLDDKIAYIMSDILSDNKARSPVFGSNSPLFIKGRPVAAKTGTTDDYADSWTVGYTPQYTTGVWIGNNDRSKMARVSGVEGAAFIWQDIMKAIHQGLPVEEFTRPEGITELWINPRTGLPAKYNGSPNQKEVFIAGTETKPTEKFDYLKVFRK